ncbi:N-acyl-D-amino-acid deacylase family protein [Sphingopyxis witflariensis]|uniref:D-aminoacylase n=1 Tax=Sphingopyxis witflariensis TaxID=173675 RepID=A0A246K7E5_9SPHN|nr:D-aminoacylase [Sphingopyxis witflariensis]OWR01264.1 D-aminoacylase [Sphingopyxis witflariensis]
MKHKILFGALSMLLVANAPAPEYDIVIRGGRVLDGAGNPWVRADVAVKDGKVVRIGQIPGHGTKEIDAKGRYVSPGFIDMMDQSGRVLLKSGAAENKLRMGVTTVIAGEGGPPAAAAEIPAYFQTLEKQGISVNYGTYYSSTQARMKVMGDGAGSPTPAQLEEMGREVKIAMENGAFGISSALIYAPSSFQKTSDLVSLAKVAAQCDGFYATHMRDESEGLVQAIEEAIEIGEKGGVKVEIFHLKAAFAPGWGKLMPQAVATINAARARGVDVAADLYPYTAGGTGLEIIAPSWVWADGLQKGIERLRDPKVRERMKKEVAAGSMPGWSNLVHASGGFANVRLANGFSKKYERFHGKSLAEIGATLNIDPADAAWDIALEGLPNRSVALYFMMSEQDIETALKQPWVSIGSDAAASVNLGEVDALGLPHPRAYGTFPRIIAEYVKRRPVLSLEDAVRKMTGWPAQRMGLTDRGLIRDGMRADIVIFDLDKLDDGATWEKPTALPTGIDTVIVNGVVTLDGGKHTGARAGAVLRHACRAQS